LKLKKFDGMGTGVSKVSDQIASWDTGSEMGTKAVLLHPFRPLVCFADDKETIRYHFN
jgi:regulator-associated protein of mTOR